MRRVLLLCVTRWAPTWRDDSSTVIDQHSTSTGREENSLMSLYDKVLYKEWVKLGSIFLCVCVVCELVTHFFFTEEDTHYIFIWQELSKADKIKSYEIKYNGARQAAATTTAFCKIWIDLNSPQIFCGPWLHFIWWQGGGHTLLPSHNYSCCHCCLDIEIQGFSIYFTK